MSSAHATTHTVVLPYVLAFNTPSAPEIATRLARALHAGSATVGLAQLYSALAVPMSLRTAGLRDLGMPESGIPEAVDAIVATAPATNPTPVTVEAMTHLLRCARAGEEPR